LGRYEITAPVGAGAMGEIYRARDPELDREVAIKVLPATVADDPDRLERLEREARAVGRLDHPNLLTIYDFGRHQGAPYLVCELLTGETFEDRLAKGPMPMRTALAYAAQIADGLAAAHERGIVHRDLKPANLFLTADGRVKILDFGLARLVDAATEGESRLPTLAEVTEPGMMLGTVAYMAPEQAAGKRVDHRADQFAFGIVLYEMLTGSRPFRGGTAPETLTAILRHDPEPLAQVAPGLPAPLRWIVERCLAKDPAARYDSTGDLAKELKTVRERSAELGTPAATEQRTAPRWVRPTAALLLAGVLALSAIAALLIGGRGGHAEPLAYERLTFRRGSVTAARFEPGGSAVLYSAAWDGEPSRTFLHRSGTLDPIAVGPAASRLLSASPAGELLLLADPFRVGPFLQAGELARMPAGGAPRVLASGIADAIFGPDGQPAALVRLVGSQAVVEFPLGAPSYTTRGNVFDLRLSPDGRHLAFTDTAQRGHNVGPIVVLDSGGGEPLILASQTGRGLAWSPSGREIWFARHDAIDAVDLEGRERRVGTFPSDVSLFDIAPDGRALLGVEQWRYEMAGRPPGGEARDLTWLAWSVPFDLSDDGQTILFNECLSWLDCRPALRTFDHRPPVVLAEGGFAMKLSPAGDWVLAAYLGASESLELIATGTDERRTLSVVGLEALDTMSWSPDGESLLLSGSKPGEGNRIFRLGLEGGEPLPVTPEGVAFGYFAASPDGMRLAVPLAEGGIAIYPLEGGEPEILELAGQPLQWSADGRWLYTAPLSQVPAVLQRVEIATGETEVVATLMPSDGTGVVQIAPIAVTPDGAAYVYGFIRRLTTLYSVTGLE
jgi:eukaryotic-like serine/threonine-protein kinase